MDCYKLLTYRLQRIVLSYYLLTYFAQQELVTKDRWQVTVQYRWQWVSLCEFITIL